jgi:UDP-2,4-diacetamido-2,4,6-trideoxy-beta-L-altropyranose hydrolase
MRCLTLADELSTRGIRTLFLVRHTLNWFEDILKQRGHDLIHLRAVIDDQSVDADLAHSDWLGTSQSADALECLAVLQNTPCDWIVVDHYALDARWESLLRAKTKLLVIDDLADRRHDCDLMLDQNLHEAPAARYLGRVPNDCRSLLGPRYALLRTEFLEARDRAIVRNNGVSRLLISLGGTDFHDVTRTVLEDLLDADLGRIRVDVVVGSSHPNIEGIMKLCGKHERFTCHVQVDRMADLMLRADLSIGAAGSATWERCSVGLPAILVSVADNQNEIARSVASAGAAVFAGRFQDLAAGSVGGEVNHLAKRPDKVAALSIAALQLVDGRGATRVCEALLG